MPTHILVVDDDAAIRMALSILLEAKGYVVSQAVDGADGVRQYRAGTPDIVISDMVMPGHQGLAAIAELRALDPALPIIAMSGSIEGGVTGLLTRARAAGADHVIEKPFEATELLALLGRIAAAGSA